MEAGLTLDRIYAVFKHVALKWREKKKKRERNKWTPDIFHWREATRFKCAAHNPGRQQSKGSNPGRYQEKDSENAHTFFQVLLIW